MNTIVRTFRDKLFTEIFPGRTWVPKTLIFAKGEAATCKNYLHIRAAENAVQGCTNAASAGRAGAAFVEIVREEFGKGNDFAQKITYRTTGARPRDLINEFRTSPMPRIAVTVGEAEGGEHPVNVRPAERARHGWRALGFRAERDARAKKVITSRK